jgi:hypothetical protein
MFVLLRCCEISKDTQKGDEKYKYGKLEKDMATKVCHILTVLWRPKNFGRHFLDIQVKCK